MANRILLQTLLRFSDDIKSGAAKVQDVITDYFNTTGKSVTDEERSIILNEFAKSAPANVTPLKSRAFDEIDETAESFDPDYMRGTSDTDVTAGELRGRINYPLMEKQLGVKLRGDETFEELLEIEKNTKESKQGLGSLYPKGKPGEIFDIQNDKRIEVAEFMKAMRAAGIKNEDVMNTAKITDVAEGKRAATSLARAADMAADSKVKQELLSELDDDIANYGPDWWRGMGYNEGPMGRESVGNLLENLTTTVNNGIYDDLLQRGVPEEKVDEVFTYIAGIRDNVKYDPKALVRKIAEDLELEDIKYDTTFWDNYLDEILTRIQKPEPRFADGGLV